MTRIILPLLFSLLILQDTQYCSGAQSTPLDLAKAANSSFADETPKDGKGGWTDQGSNNDMRSLPKGQHTFHGVNFNIIDNSQNNGKDCLALSQSGFASGKAKDHKHSEPNSVTVDIPGVNTKYLYLLHASGWTPDIERETGQINVEYTDGSTQTIPVKSLVDSGNWWKPFDMPNARVAWKGKNPSSEIGLYLSRFALRGKPVKKISFVCSYGMWFIGAASISTEDIPLPKYTPPSFEYTQRRLQERYPEFSLGESIAQAMQGQPSLAAKSGAFRGCPAVWLNGKWKLLPVYADKIPATETIVKTDIFVPSLMGAKKYFQKEAYQKQGKGWDRISRMWYSTNLAVPADWQSNLPLVLHFQAVDFLGAVFINGKFLRLHTGRFTPFEVELPETIKPGDCFNLSVFVLKITEAIQNGKCPFMQGVGYEYGGITAPAVLYQDTPLRLKHVRVVTSVKDKTITISAETDNANNSLNVTPAITPLSGQSSEGIPQFQALNAKGKLYWQAKWDDPALWSPEAPTLYQLTLTVDGKPGVHTKTTESFGFREISIRGDRILLNGIPIRLFGLSYEPQGDGAWQRADEDFNYRYLMNMREGLKINAVRFHHTPAFPAQLRAADRAGILVINQSGLWTGGRFANYRAGEDFLKNMQTELSEWVWRDINHPSNIIWDTANEYIIGSPEWTDFWINLDKIVARIDNTRIIEQSGSGTHSAGPMLSHFHNGDCLNLASSKLPVIYGEFWISACGGKQPLTLPRKTFTPQEFNALWLYSVQDLVTRMRMNNASGIFPFHQLEHSFRMNTTAIPADIIFSPSSFNPKKLNSYTYLNPYQPLSKQLDPQFSKAMDVIFAPVAAYIVEGENNFSSEAKSTRHLYIANDSMEHQRISTEVAMNIADNTINILKQDIELAAGEAKTIPINITAPKSSGTGAIEINLSYGNGKKFTCSYPASVYEGLTGKGEVNLYGTDQKLVQALQKAGYRINHIDKIQPSNLPLIIAENALDLVNKADVNELLIQKGQRILVLAQDKVNFAETMGLTFRQAGRGRDGYHASISDKLLTDTMNIYEYSYPGGNGKAYTGSYSLPMPQAQSLPQVHKISGGTAFTDLTSLRYELDHGNIIFCQLLLSQHLIDDPRAEVILQGLIKNLDLKPDRKSGSIYCPDSSVAKTLEESGYSLSKTVEESELAVVKAAEYSKNTELQNRNNVIVYECAKDIDGRKAKIENVRHFTKVLVSPDIPGLWNLQTGNFQPLIDAGAFCRSVNPPTLPVLHLENSRIAVAGNRASHQYDIITSDNYYPLVSYYKDDEKNRWITALNTKYPYVASMALSVARGLKIDFAPKRAVMRYDIARAREMKIDGNIEEWCYEGDLNLHNWSRAQPLQFNLGEKWGLFYSLADSGKLYIAIAGADNIMPLSGKGLRINFGKNNLLIKRIADGAVSLELDGKKLSGVQAKWKKLTSTPVDASSAKDLIMSGFSLEIAIPVNSLELQGKMHSSISAESNSTRYPKDGHFTITLEGVRKVSEARIDISSKDAGFEVIDASNGSVFGVPVWHKQNKYSNRNITATFPIDSTSWTTANFSFRANKDTTISIKLRAPHKTVSGVTQKIWVGYDSINLTGATLINGDFKKAYNGMPAGWQLWKDAPTGDKGEYITEGGAEDGDPWIKLWHNCPVVQNVKVKAGEVLKLFVQAKAVSDD